MTLSKGQTVVHPVHGPARITGVTTRLVRDVRVSYLKLEVRDTDLTIGVPFEQAEAMGLRPVLDDEQRAAMHAALGGPSEPEESDWSRRFKANQEKLRTGDIVRIAGVVRDLTRRQATRGISPGERELLKYARRPIVSEMSVALGVANEEASRMLDDLILARVRDGRLPSAS